MDSWQNIELEYIFLKEKIYFFKIQNNSQKVDNKKISDIFGKFSISFRDFEIFLITRYKENLKIPKGNWKFSKNIRNFFVVNFLRIILYFEKIYFFFQKYIFQLNILSGVQKSYLERRAISKDAKNVKSKVAYTKSRILVTCYV